MDFGKCYIGGGHPPPEWRNLKKQHAVAIAEKTVTLTHSMLISSQHPLPPGEGAHQHQQRRLWKVKVGQKAADDLESVTRPKKDLGLP